MPDNRASPMENPLDDKFLKGRYESELSRKDKLSDSLGLPVSVLIVLGGLAVTMVRGFSFTNRPLSVAFLVLVGITTVSFIVSLWYLSHAYHGNYDYQRLPSLNDLYKALNDYQTYYLEYPNASDEEKETLAFEDFDGNLRWRIIQAADQNARSNNSRQRCLHLAIVALFAVMVGTLLSAVPYGVDQVLYPAKSPVMHIDNLDQRREPLMPQTPAPSQTPPAPHPQSGANPSAPKPDFPANTVFRNDQQIAPKK
jgi:hypothetical protein